MIYQESVDQNTKVFHQEQAHKELGNNNSKRIKDIMMRIVVDESD